MSDHRSLYRATGHRDGRRSGHKCGCHRSATGLRLPASEAALAHLHPATDLFVTNRNHLAEIQARTNHQLNYIIPAP